MRRFTRLLQRLALVLRLPFIAILPAWFLPPDGRPDPSAAGRRRAHRSGDLSQQIGHQRLATSWRQLATSSTTWREGSRNPMPAWNRKVEERTHELQTRSGELAQSVEELRALGEVTRAVNSTLDCRPCCPTIVAKAVQLSGTEALVRSTYWILNGRIQLRATHGMSDELIADLDHQGIGLGEKTMAEVEARRAPIQLADLKDVEASPAQSISAAGRLPSAARRPTDWSRGHHRVQVGAAKGRPASFRSTPSTCC